MNLKDAMKRIEELEKRVKELEMRPQQHIHYHQAPYVPATIPVPHWAPTYPVIPWTPTWTITSGGGSIGNAGYSA